tara:strand:+ start:1988 stop:2677 length:690 start_codon:yes stop_codon:yes gene_type:complete
MSKHFHGSNFYSLEITELSCAISQVVDFVEEICDTFSHEIIFNDLRSWLDLNRTEELDSVMSKYIWSFLGFNISNSHKKFKSLLKKTLPTYSVERDIINHIWNHPIDYYKYQISSRSEEDVIFLHGAPPAATVRGIYHVSEGVIHIPGSELYGEENNLRDQKSYFKIPESADEDVKITPKLLGWELGIFLSLVHLDHSLASKCEEIIDKKELKSEALESSFLSLILTNN